MFDNDDDNDMRDLADYYQPSESMRNYVDCQLCGCLVNDHMLETHRKNCKPKPVDLCKIEGHIRGRREAGKCSKLHYRCRRCKKTFHVDEFNDEEFDDENDDIEDELDGSWPGDSESRLESAMNVSRILRKKKSYKKPRLRPRESKISKAAHRLLRDERAPKRKRRRGAVTSKKTKRK